MKKIQKISLLLAALTVSAVLLPACGGGGGGGEATSGNETAPGNVTGNATEAPKTTKAAERAPLGLPSADYKGESFVFLTYPKTAAGTAGQFSEFRSSTDAAGDLVNDAVYDRNMIIEGRYNINIETIENTDVKGTAQKSILAGDTEFDVILPYVDGAFPLAQEKLLVDLNTVPHMDLDSEWWDQAMRTDLAIGKKNFVMSGDILMSAKELANFIGYNKDILREYSLEDPYKLVNDGAWTLDKLAEMSAQVTRDSNGDGVINEEDLLGATHDYAIAYYLYSSTGERTAALDESGAPKLTFNTSRATAVLEKLEEIYNDPMKMYMVTKIPNTWTKNREMFVNNQILFQIGSIYVIQTRREMIKDFGILPIPKYDENQKDYYHMPATQLVQSITIPATNKDLDRAGIILETLAYESKDTVLRAYYEYNLQTKIARDEESGAMLDIIFGTTFYDIGLVFGWGGFKTLIGSAVKGTESFAALYAAQETKAQTEMDKAYDAFK